jgi:cyclopropane fatty-acyl-phospholipid synthase-like methyltransferase
MPAQKIGEVVNIKDAGACKILDIAASHGMFGITLAKMNPQAQVTGLDWANVLEVAQENAQAAGVADRFHKLPGSAFDVDYGTGYDLILITNFLHHFDIPTCEKFLRKVHAALAPGGRAVTLEFVPDEDRVSPPQPASFSMMMLATTPAGDAYTFSEFESMFRNAGFSASTIDRLDGRFQSIIVSRK